MASMRRLTRVLTIAAAAFACTYTTLIASLMLEASRERVWEWVWGPHPMVAVGTVFGFVLGCPFALALLLPTDLRRTIPITFAVIFASALLITATTRWSLGAFAGLIAGVAVMGREHNRARPTLDGRSHTVENPAPHG